MPSHAYPCIRGTAELDPGPPMFGTEAQSPCSPVSETSEQEATLAYLYWGSERSGGLFSLPLLGTIERLIEEALGLMATAPPRLLVGGRRSLGEALGLSSGDRVRQTSQ